MTTRPEVAATSGGWTFTGRHMLLVMFAFFGVVIAVNVTLAVFASTTWSGLVVSNSYVASQEFQARHDALEKQLALGWSPRFSYVPGTAHFVIKDAGGNPVDLGPIALQVSRPVGTHDDQTVQFERTPNGEYVAPLSLGKGVWDLRIATETTSQGPFEFEERFTVEAEDP